MTGQADSPVQPASALRLKVGTALFAFSILLPLAGVPLVTAIGLSTTATASVTGALLFTAEILGIVAVAVMGKSGYAVIKNRVLGFFKQYGPPRKVGRLRYTIGLAMFVPPLLLGWLFPYAARIIPDLSEVPLPYALGGDLLLLSSLYVLGGNFWDKIRALFVHDAEARFAEAKP